MNTERFSMVQLTLLSIIVALILENLLNQLSGSELDWTTLLPWLKSILVFVTAVTMWSGFTLILTVSRRPVGTVDFLYPFGILIFTSLAANAVAANDTVTFFLYSGLGRGFAASALIAECLYAKRHNEGMPLSATLLQSAMALMEVGAALAAYLAMLSVAWAQGILMLLIVAQVFGVAGTILGWRAVTRQLTPPDEPAESSTN